MWDPDQKRCGSITRNSPGARSHSYYLLVLFGGLPAGRGRTSDSAVFARTIDHRSRYLRCGRRVGSATRVLLGSETPSWNGQLPRRVGDLPWPAAEDISQTSTLS